MRGRKNTVGKIYPKYRPYPFSLDWQENGYSPETLESGPDTEPRAGSRAGTAGDFRHLIGDAVTDDWFQARPASSNAGKGPGPLHLLQSLFADRLDFLQRALDELESAKDERQRLVSRALDELDPEIRDCEVSLSTLKAAFNNTEEQRHLERRMFELKRERRREALLSWRDLVWLRGEIRKLQREIDALQRTSGTAGGEITGGGQNQG